MEDSNSDSNRIVLVSEVSSFQWSQCGIWNKQKMSFKLIDYATIILRIIGGKRIERIIVE